MADAGEPAIDGVAVDEMRSYLDGTDVVFAVLFGSRVRGTAGESSDVDVAVKFPEDLDERERERFRRRNRIDAELQTHADGFVDVSDVDALPVPVAHAALQDGIVLVGDERAVSQYREGIAREYEASADDRERRQREFIDRLASGDV